MCEAKNLKNVLSNPNAVTNVKFVRAIGREFLIVDKGRVGAPQIGDAVRLAIPFYSGMFL
jgi:hypothetical protein